MIKLNLYAMLAQLETYKKFYCQAALWLDNTLAEYWLNMIYRLETEILELGYKKLQLTA